MKQALELFRDTGGKWIVLHCPYHLREQYEGGHFDVIASILEMVERDIAEIFITSEKKFLEVRAEMDSFAFPMPGTFAIQQLTEMPIKTLYVTGFPCYIR